jgi:hypothetical protein
MVSTMPSSPVPKRRHRRGVLDQVPGAPADPPSPAATAPATTPPPQAASAHRLTVNLPTALIDRLRDVVYHSPGLTLASLSAAALTREIDRLEKERGNPFPSRRGPIRVGRPIQ